jgi:hypothetical protein
MTTDDDTCEKAAAPDDHGLRLLDQPTLARRGADA